MSKRERVLSVSLFTSNINPLAFNHPTAHIRSLTNTCPLDLEVFEQMEKFRAK